MPIKAKDHIPALPASFAPTVLPATPSNAPAGNTGTTAGAWDTAANRDAAIATINSNKARIDAIEAALKNLGLLG